MRLKSLARALFLTVLMFSISRSQESLKFAIQTIDLSQPSASSASASFQAPMMAKKSVALAVLYSLILPGLGDFYADNSHTAKYFVGAEATLWLTYGSFRVYGNWLKEDAQSFAIQKAGANFGGKNDQFAVNLGNFDNVFQYDAVKLQNREYDLIYDPNSNFSWSWSSTLDRERYKNLRIRGDEVLHNSQYVLGVLFINRVIAAVSAVKSVVSYNRQVDLTGAWRLTSRLTGGSLATQGIELTLSKDF